MEEYRKNGNEEFKKGRYKEAIQWYSKGLDIDPKDVILYANRAMAYIKLEQWAHGLKDCQQGIALDRSNIKLWHRQGLCLKSLKRYQEARRSFLEVIELDESNKDAVHELKQLSLQGPFEVTIAHVDTLPSSFTSSQSKTAATKTKPETQVPVHSLTGTFSPPTGPLSLYKLKELMRAPEQDLAQIYNYLIYSLPPHQLVTIHSNGGLEYDVIDFVVAAIIYTSQNSDTDSWVAASAGLLNALEQCPRFQMSQMMANSSKIQRAVKLLKEKGCPETRLKHWG